MRQVLSCLALDSPRKANCAEVKVRGCLFCWFFRVELSRRLPRSRIFWVRVPLRAVFLFVFFLCFCCACFLLVCCSRVCCSCQARIELATFCDVMTLAILTTRTALPRKIQKQVLEPWVLTGEYTCASLVAAVLQCNWLQNLLQLLFFCAYVLITRHKRNTHTDIHTYIGGEVTSSIHVSSIVFVSVRRQKTKHVHPGRFELPPSNEDQNLSLAP